MKVSVCTLAKGRQEHLKNLVLGLRRSIRPPLELVVAVMDEARYDLPMTSFPLRQVVLGSEGASQAKGRNAAAAKATGDLLVFLDVDCIPHPELIDDYAASARRGGVLMGEVGYLPKGATARGIEFDRFEAQAVLHPDQPEPPSAALAPCRDYRRFRSANFAIMARDFAAIGGFDERYVGHGGEDTDFGRMIVNRGLPLSWVRGARAYHQHHPHHVPPVHHLDSVLRDAHLFSQKWGQPTMQPWLRAFTLMGLIEQTERGWRKLREPNEKDFALTGQQADQPCASSAEALDLLEKRVASRPASGRSAAGSLRPAA